MNYIIFILGTILGSFTSCLAIRRTRGESIVYPSSHCDSCGRKLNILDLVPIFSYIKLKGKCMCGAKIGLDKLLAELFSGTIFILFFYKYGFGNKLFFYIFFYLLLLKISIIDYLTLAAYEEDLMAILVLSLINQVYNFNNGYFYITISIIQLILLLLYFYISKKEVTIIGEGDLILFASLIGFFSPLQAFYFLAYSSWLALIPALYYWKKGEKHIPMLPFISLSFIICILRWV